MKSLRNDLVIERKMPPLLIKKASCLFSGLAFFCFLSLTTFAQDPARKASNQTQQLSASERLLVQSSKAAILAAGISASYFDKHFKLLRVIDAVADRRVMWEFSIGQYIAIVNDEVGFYTDIKGQRINAHSIRNVLSTAHDIKKTIPKKRAEQFMFRCIGKNAPGGVVFQSFGSGLKASLLLTASSIPKPSIEKGGKERRESRNTRREEDTPNTHDGKSQADSMEEMEDESDNNRPIIYTGFIDLETGICTKGIAQAGHPVPLRK